MVDIRKNYISDDDENILRNEVVLSYDSVISAKADASLSIGDTVGTLGFDSESDNGGAVYLVVSGGTGVSDGILYINMDNGNQLERQEIPTQVFDNVASAKLAPWVAIGDNVKTLGYYTPNDGGGADYIVVAGGTGVDDGGSYHDMANGNQLGLINETKINYLNYGLAADGVTDDTARLQAFEAVNTGEEVDLQGKVVAVTYEPILNKYYNGTFNINGTNNESQFDTLLRVSDQAEHILIGEGAGESLPNYTTKSQAPFGYNIIAIGKNSQQFNQTQQNNYSIGTGALNKNQYGVYNTVFGFEASYETLGDAGNDILGSRNVVVGDNAYRMSVTGYNNMVFGRNSFYSNDSGFNNIAMGVEALAGIAPISLGGEIINATPKSCANNIALGSSALFWSNGNNNQAIGFDASTEIKTGQRNVSYGTFAMRDLEINNSFLGTARSVDGGTYNYSQALTTITITKTSHGLVTGDSIVCVFLTGGTANSNNPQVLVVTSTPTADTYTVESPVSKTATGTVRVDETWDQVAQSTSDSNTAIGYNAMSNATFGDFNSAFGEGALQVTQSSGSNTAIGVQSFKNLTTGIQNSGLGVLAGSLKQDSSNNTDLSNTTCIGYNSRCSASNQVQLGDSSTTTYAYGAVQDRSDARDKIDVNPISDSLIRFFMDVEWKTYRLNYRDNYTEVDTASGEVIIHDNDGSRAGSRHHIGAIAQQVEEAMIKHNVDFAGLQHHSVKGGLDLYTIGYQEFIGIQGEIIQRQEKRLDDIESRLKLAGI